MKVNKDAVQGLALGIDSALHGGEPGTRYAFLIVVSDTQAPSGDATVFASNVDAATILPFMEGTLKAVLRQREKEMGGRPIILRP